jgi:phosphoenolpyruvate carboxylase
VHNGRIRFTEQGEIISFRYALPDIARRHVEQIVSATLETTALVSPESDDPAGRVDTDSDVAALMDRIAEESMSRYRELIDEAEAWAWYTRVTPIEHISRLPIASRPVSRASDDGQVDFDNLRAIPWVFAWTQTRYIVPGWYGIGHALARLIDDRPEALDTLRTLYRHWPFFAAVLDSAQREMARARLPLAARYDAMARSTGAGDGQASALDSGSAPSPFHRAIASDYEKARRALLRITGQEALFDNSPVLKKSIRLRNPYTDVLNLVQIELLRRYRSTDDPDRRDALGQVLLLSLNGIAAAMQSTG